jgi:hypothetical protein
MTRAQPKSKKSLPQNPPLQVKTITITQADQDTLDRLGRDLTDYTGRAVSGSAIVRALVCYAGQQRYDWGLAYLSPLIEQEMSTGIVWGKKAVS